MAPKTAVAEIGTATQYTVITDGDAIQVAKSISEAKVALDNAIETYEVRLLATPVIWKSKSSDGDISKGSGVSKAMVGIYRRTGRILAVTTPSKGVKPSMVASAVNRGFNAPGSLKANVDEVIDELLKTKDAPTWSDAIKAINKAVGGDAPAKKTPAEKADGHIKALADLKSKGLVFTKEQKAALAAL